MATLGSKLVTREMQWLANMTDLNQLGHALHAKPEKFMGVMDTLFSSRNYYSDNPILSMLMGGKNEKTISSLEWEWDLKSNGTRPAIVIENVNPLTNTTPGKFRRTFKLKLDVDWYLPGDILNPGSSNKKYQVRVVDTVQRHGDHSVYTVRMMSDLDADFIPLKYLTPGTKWAKLFSMYEEAAEQDGSTVFSTPISLRGRMSKFRKQYRITDYASTEVLAVAVVDSNGKSHSSWFRYAEVEYWQQWYRELERGVWYTRSTDTVMGASGRPVKSGPGIQELLEDSNVERYSHLTAKFIEEYLMDIFYAKVKPGKGRSIKAFTGEYGMLQFHRAIEDRMAKTGFIRNVEVYTNKVGSEYHSNALEFGYQMVKYNMANGSSLELIHNPLYDDQEINFEIDPVTGYPMESQRFTFLDFTGDGGKSNVTLMKKKDGEAFGYVEGMYGPSGPSKGGKMAHSGDYYSMHVEKTCGVHIEDVTKCGELILARA